MAVFRQKIGLASKARPENLGDMGDPVVKRRYPLAAFMGRYGQEQAVR